jgi:hypothetical protein
MLITIRIPLFVLVVVLVLVLVLVLIILLRICNSRCCSGAAVVVACLSSLVSYGWGSAQAGNDVLRLLSSFDFPVCPSDSSGTTSSILRFRNGESGCGLTNKTCGRTRGRRETDFAC